MVYCLERDPAADINKLEEELAGLVKEGTVKLCFGSPREANQPPSGLVAGKWGPVFEFAGWLFAGWAFVKEAPEAAENVRSLLTNVSGTLARYEQIVVFWALNTPAMERVRRVCHELQLTVRELPEASEPKDVADATVELSQNGQRRAQYQSQMRELLSRKKRALEECDLKTSEELSRQMGDLQTKEAKLPSVVIIRT
jgi:hypothetical protein